MLKVKRLSLWSLVGVILTTLGGLGPATAAKAQSPSVPEAASREKVLEDRLKAIESRYETMERLHAEQYEALKSEIRSLKSQAVPATPKPPRAAVEGSGGDRMPEAAGREVPKAGSRQPQGGGVDGTDGPRVGVNSYEPPGGDTTGGDPARGAQGTIGRRDEAGEDRSIKTVLGNGLRFKSDDGAFELQFHDLTQTELRAFPGAGGQSPVKTQFFVPRQRWYFTGHATENVEFYTVVNRGYGSLDLLDAFINFKYDPRFQLRAGRTKTPTSYEYYQIAEGDLIAPERSLFVGNLSGNRQDGFMLHGQVLDKRAEYAVGLFNGPRRSFGDFNNSKDLYTFINVRPWEQSESLTALKYLNLGGAFNFGDENNPAQPSIFTTANDQTSGGNTPVVRSLSPAFFQFNNDVVERGRRAQWSGWVAWYYRSFNLLAEYDGAFQDYATGSRPTRTRVPYEGFSVTAYYFLTGEQITRRADVKPLRDFAFKDGRFTGPGAFEVYSRFSSLNIGRDAFSSGLADPNLWTGQAYAVDTGVNWYLNRYTKVYLDWQHSFFGDPVSNGRNAYAKHFDLLWLRFQLFF